MPFALSTISFIHFILRKKEGNPLFSILAVLQANIKLKPCYRPWNEFVLHSLFRLFQLFALIHNPYFYTISLYLFDIYIIIMVTGLLGCTLYCGMHDACFIFMWKTCATSQSLTFACKPSKSTCFLFRLTWHASMAWIISLLVSFSLSPSLYIFFSTFPSFSFNIIILMSVCVFNRTSCECENKAFLFRGCFLVSKHGKELMRKRNNKTSGGNRGKRMIMGIYTKKTQ